MTVNVAVIQPITDFGPNAREKNLENARLYALEAARKGAHIACFPETYPGLWRAPITWTPIEELKQIAREANIYLIGSYAEPVDAEGQRGYLSSSLIGPDGAEIGRYRRTTPNHEPWIYKGGDFWDFDWIHANELPVFDTDLGKIGMLICSEVYAPELARGLALKGAEIVFLPTGLNGRTSSLYATWRTLTWARAIENLMCTAVCANIVPSRNPEGLAMICSPEEVLLESYEEGVHLAQVDLDRIRWLRAEQDRMVQPFPWGAKPGTLRDWRRQAVLDANPELLRGTE